MTTPLVAGEHVRTITVNERTRNYLVHVPQTPDVPRAMPVVLAFHGATSNFILMRNFCGLSEKAESAGFVVVYPAGTGHSRTVLTWNGGQCCGYAMKNHVDDVAFIRALLDDLGSVVWIDPRRIFATGMSNGAMMAYRLAAECADRIAAIAPVAGPMGIDHPRPVRPVPVLHIHGTADEFAPFHGGKGARSTYGTNFRSIPESIVAWVHINHCDPTPTIIADPPRVEDGTRIIRRIHPGNATTVTLITVEGGGHTWPGRPPFPATLGKSTANLHANDAIWDFFKKYPMPE